MKKIAIIEPVGGHGGMEYYDYGLANGLVGAGVTVYLYTCNHTKLQNYPEVITQPVFGNIWKQSTIPRFWSFIKGYKKAFADAASKNISVVHFHFFQLSWLNYLALYLSRNYKFKRVITVHDVSAFGRTQSENAEKRILKKADKLVVHNKFSFQELKKKGVPEGKIAIVPHGNYLDFVAPVPYPKENKETLDLLFFGQIKKEKGLDVLLEALAIVIRENPNVRLTIAGKPYKDEMDTYLQQINRLGISEFVHANFTFIPNESLPELFEKADIIVLPYRKIYQSGVLLLAMSYERAVICSNLPAFEEIVEHNKNGFIFENENPASLATLILYICKNRNALPDISRTALSKLKQEYSWVEIGKKMKTIYEAS